MAITDAGGPTPPQTAPARAAAAATAATRAHALAAHDWIIVVYLAILLVALAFGSGPSRASCMVTVAAHLGVYACVIVLVRAKLLRWGGAASSLVQRLATIVAILGTFFRLREILPAVAPYSLDAGIYAFDLRVFGVEPSVYFDRFVSPATTEWFAFFYFLYFLILCAHVLPMLFLQRDTQVVARFGLGFLLVICTGHLLYMVVPGWGPYWYLQGTFAHELQGGIFWRLARGTVDEVGAQKDIFPSLHTAAPTFFALFSFRHRKIFPFKYTWGLVAFLATQIIIATMFLRWHYFVDIVAGITLAAGATVLGARIADWESARRERFGVQPSWTPLVLPSLRFGAPKQPWTKAED